MPPVSSPAPPSLFEPTRSLMLSSDAPSLFAAAPAAVPLFTLSASHAGTAGLSAPNDAPAAPPLPPASPRPGCPADNTRVLLVGDSLAAGLGPVMERLATACGTPFWHHGVVGSHATQWVHDEWIVPQLDRAQPTVVLVSLGGNDFQRFDPDRVEVAIANLVAKIRKQGAQLLWISPPTMPFRDRIGARDMWKSALGGEVHRDWYPTEKLTIPRVHDRVHPTAKGNHALSRILWQWTASATS